MNYPDACLAFLGYERDEMSTGGPIEERMEILWMELASSEGTMPEPDAKAFFDPHGPTMRALRDHAATALRKRQRQIQKEEAEFAGYYGTWLGRLAGPARMLTFLQALAMFRGETDENVADILECPWIRQCEHEDQDGMACMALSTARAFFDVGGSTMVALRASLKQEHADEVQALEGKLRAMKEDHAALMAQLGHT